MEFRDLGPRDRLALEAFQCFDSAIAASIIVDEMVRERLPDEVANPHGPVSAMGLWDGSELVGVIAWRIQLLPRIPPYTNNWLVALLAVHNRRRHEGHGARLKRELYSRAKAAGIERIISEVDRDNAPMIAVNSALSIPRAIHPNYPTDTWLYTWSVE